MKSTQVVCAGADARWVAISVAGNAIVCHGWTAFVASNEPERVMVVVGCDKAHAKDLVARCIKACRSFKPSMKVYVQYRQDACA